MDVRNSQLVVGLAIVFSFVVAVMAYVAFRKARQSTLDFEDVGRSRVAQRAVSRRSVYDRNRLDSAREESQALQQMRELLDARTRLLRARSEELERKSGEHAELETQHQILQARYRELSAESDRTMELLADFMSEASAASENAAARTDDAEFTPDAEAVEPSPEQIESEIDADLVQWQLDQANARIAELEMSVVREILRSTEATRALMATGEAAVVPLVDLLADENVELRIWAATVLGQIGPDASLSEDVLVHALSDADERVRRAARTALVRIADE